jgi:hypothetical protein
MDDKAGNLRRHAASCRFQARSAVSMRTRTVFFTMAYEMDEEAAAIDRADPLVLD